MNEDLRAKLEAILKACDAAGFSGAFLLDELLGDAFHASDAELQEIRDWLADWKGSEVGRV